MIGTVHGLPSDGFSFTRSYISGLMFTPQFILESVSNGHYIFNDFGTYNDRIHMVLHPQAYSWGSNHYTLTGVFKEAYFFALPSTTPSPLNFTVRYKNPTPARPAYLEIIVPFFTDPSVFYPLPSRDRPYWLP